MRITEFPMIEEIREEYRQLRENGKSRDEATETLMKECANEIITGGEDDGLLFWIGLADGQFAVKELTEEVSQMGLASLDRLQALVPELTPGDITRRRERYAQAPMPEKKVRKRKRYRCSWNIGDTFAYQVSGPEAESLNIAGKYFLFRKVDETEFENGQIIPIATVSLWDKQPFPSTTEEFQSVPFLKVCNGGRCGSSKSDFEYRVAIIIKTTKQLDSMQLQHVGNFPNVTLPEDEIIFTNAWENTLMLPHMIEMECCQFWKSHLYCTQKQKA